jgi:hypothetical protein
VVTSAIGSGRVTGTPTTFFAALRGSATIRRNSGGWNPTIPGGNSINDLDQLGTGDVAVLTISGANEFVRPFNPSTAAASAAINFSSQGFTVATNIAVGNSLGFTQGPVYFVSGIESGTAKIARVSSANQSIVTLQNASSITDLGVMGTLIYVLDADGAIDSVRVYGYNGGTELGTIVLPASYDARRIAVSNGSIAVLYLEAGTWKVARYLVN